MSEKQDKQDIYDQFQEEIDAENFPDAVELFSNLHVADQAELFNFISDADQEVILQHLDIDTTANLFDELDDDETLEAAGALTLERLADVLDEMDPDEAADLLGDLPRHQANEALSQMDEPEDVLPLLAFPDDTAGGRMTTSFIALRGDKTTQDAIAFIRQSDPEIEVPYYLFVIDKDNTLIGVVEIRQLVLSNPDVLLDSYVDHSVVSIDAYADQEEAARLMARYDLKALAVVGERKKLLGVITHDDLVDVLEDEATEDIYRLANLSNSDLEPESDILLQLKGRLPWLFVNTVTALFASWVISNFEGLIGQIAVLAIFQSVVAGQGGNAGSQSVALLVRALALDKVQPNTLKSIVTKQVLVGLFQGILVGAVVGIGAGLWRGNWALGVVLGLAMVGNMIVAGFIGTLAPLGLKAIGQDPALASTVLVTAVTDSCGFFIFLSLAKLFLPYLS